MLGSKWSYVLTDLKGTRLGQIQNAYEREYNANLNRPSTAGFQLRKDNPAIPYLFNQEEDYLLQIWQDATLRFWGPILTANYTMNDGQPASIAVTAADAMWYMSMRYWWTTLNSAGLTLTGDKITVAEQLIAAQNARWPTRLVTPGGQLSGSTGTYSTTAFKQGTTAINDLAQGLDGFDWYVAPLNTATASTKEWIPYIGVFRAAATVGSTKPNAVFEYGTGRRNMKSMNFLMDQTTRANLIWNVSEIGLESSAANPSPLISSGDEKNYLRFGLYEDMAELPGVADATMRTKYVEEMLHVRKDKRRILTMTSDVDDGTGRVPSFGDEYWLGDTITAHGVDEGFTLFSGLVRVYSVQVKINNNGTATYTPILVEES